MYLTQRPACCRLGLIVLVTLSGCAQAYYRYSCGCVPSAYYPGRPLPYRTNCDCLLPTGSPDPSSQVAVGTRASAVSE